MSGPPPWLQALPRAVVLLDTAGRVVEANAAADQLFGAAAVTPGEPFARTARRAMDDRGGVDEVREQVATGARWRGELVLPTAAGPRRLYVDVAPLPSGQPAQVLLIAEPGGAPAERISRLSERLTRLVRVSAELQAVEDLPELADVVVSHLADAAGATAASVSLLVEPGVLGLVALRGGPPGTRERWATFPADETTPAGATLLSGRPLLIVGRAELERRYPQVTLSAGGERSMLCLPLVVRSEAIGVVTLSFPSRVDLDDELEFYRAMADVCAQAVERLRAQQTVDVQRARLAFLARASEELGRSLDMESTLQVVARLAVPDHADWCAISLERDGRLHTVTVSHADPALQADAERFAARYLVSPATASTAYHVLRTGESLLLPEITDEMLDAGEVPEHQRDMIRRMGFRSALLVPLRTHERVLGTLIWVGGEDSRRFGSEELAFAEDLGRRAAVALDNALLHGELRDVARRLEAAVQPAPLPELPAWHLAAFYRSAGPSTVGGDFYDAIPLHEGRLALVVGDVMGHGVEAAAAMSQLRAAVRAFVAVDPDPQVVLGRLDTFYERFPSHQLVTLLYAVVDPRRDQVVVLCAGHPPPLVVRADGSAEFLEAVQGTILGVGRTERRRTVAPLRPGDTFVLFTDGLIERRGEDLATGKERLRRLAAELRVRAEPTVLRTLAEAMSDPEREDDVAVLAATRVVEGGGDSRAAGEAAADPARAPVSGA